MSHLRPRQVVGLAAAGLAAAAFGFPVTAAAEPGAAATPAATSSSATSAPSAASAKSVDAAKDSPKPTSSQTATAQASGSTTPSPTSTPSSAVSAPSSSSSTSTPTPSASPSAAETTSSADSGSLPQAAEETSQPRTAQDAVQAPQSAATATPEEQASAQAEDPSAAGISLTKTASPSRVSKVGQVITYRFVAANTGSVDLTDVAITDGLEGLSSLSCDQSSTAATLTPKQALHCSATLTVTQAVLDFGDIDNFATVFGQYDIEGQGDYVGANAAAHVSVSQQPSIALRASVSPSGKADRGDRLRYAATATNTGNVTLTAARITSGLAGLGFSCQPAASTTLAPGASISCSGAYRVTKTDARRGHVSATLTARAEQPYGDPSDSGDDITDSSTLRTAVTKLASSGSSASTGSGSSASTGAGSTSPELADTGSPEGSLPIGLLGAVLAVSGIGLIRRGRRR